METDIAKCGNCAYGQSMPNDLSKRICRCLPPQITPVPSAHGVQYQGMFPIVNATDYPCGQHKMKMQLDTTSGNA